MEPERDALIAEQRAEMSALRSELAELRRMLELPLARTAPDGRLAQAR